MMNQVGMGFVWIWPVLLLVGVAALVWGLSRAAGAGGGSGGSGGDERARAVLRDRFARGEITEQEYRDRMRVLDED